MAIRKLVLGLSVDEELSWGIAEVSADPRATGQDAYPASDFEHAFVCELPNSAKGGTPVDVPALTIKSLLDACANDRHLLEKVRRLDGIGVSTVGLADSRNGRLIDIRRKPWPMGTEDFIFDFQGLFRDLFSALNIAPERSMPIVVHNDATAKSMIHRCFSNLGEEGVLCFVNLAEGINIGVAHRSGPMSTSDLHPEMGHSYPRLALADEIKYRPLLEQVSGCPAHITCFEGLASNARVRNQWHAPLERLGPKHEAFEIVADYIAQLCWSSTLALAPTRIILGGPMASLQLAKKVRKSFLQLNRGPHPKSQPYLRAPAYPAMDDIDDPFISTANKIPLLEGSQLSNPLGLMGSIELGRFAAMFKALR